MKTLTKLTLAGLAATLFATGAALADDSGLRAIDNHHGVVTYYRPAQPQVTIAFAGHANAVQRTDAKVERGTSTFRQVSTPHGTVSYFAPAE